jgi:hypothetical protein
MPRDIQDRRGGTRHKLPKAITAELEVEMSDGQRWRFPLLDISLNDACFRMPAGAPEVQTGTNLADAVIRAGNFAIGCHLSVLRTWRLSDRSLECGARLYPKGEADQNELISFVSALEATAQGKKPD